MQGGCLLAALVFEDRSKVRTELFEPVADALKGRKQKTQFSEPLGIFSPLPKIDRAEIGRAWSIERGGR